MKAFSNAITLHCGDWECDILPALAANAVRLEWRGEPVLRQLPDLETWQKHLCVYGTPVLLPANRTAAGKFTFAGKEYQLPVNEVAANNHIHGRLHSQHFTVCTQHETAVACHYDNTGDIYPFPFAADFSAELSADGLRQHFTLTNTGSTAMPFTFAIHASFAEPESFAVPLGEEWVCNPCHIPTGERRPLNEQQRQWCVSGISKGENVTGFFTSAGQTARVGRYAYTVSDNFDQWVLFNAHGAENYFCAEPQCGPVNGLNMPDGHRVLQPGEKITFTTQISRLP